MPRIGGYLCVVSVLCWSLLSQTVAAAELYRYRNKEGVLVLANTIPAELVPQGYTVLDHRGKILRVVPRQLSEEEARQQAEEQAAEREAEAERLAQTKKDEELLRLYRSPNDIKRALDRKLESDMLAIEVLRTSLRMLQDQRQKLQGQIAVFKGSGAPVPKGLASRLQDLDEQVTGKQRAIESRESKMIAVREEYAEYQERLRYLLGLTGDA